MNKELTIILSRILTNTNLNMMKTFMNRFNLLFAFAAVLFMVSCDDEDPIVITPTDGINVADGYYMSTASGEPTSALALTAESVEDDGFGSQDRAGYNAGYMYLGQGSYNIVQITEKEETDRLGGIGEVITDTGSGCEFNDYTLVNVSSGGAGFSVAAAGLYKVTHDQMTNEVILYKIENAGLIGSATPGGWGSDTPLSGTVTADGGSWSATEVLLRTGEFKLRFNCRWNLDRRIDPAAGFEAANGYQLFTNFGGASNNLEPGNDAPNIPVALEEEAFYTVDVNWDPIDGFTMNLTKTADAPIITFVPDDHEWAVIGDATNLEDLDMDGTPDGWQTDTDMNYEGFDSGTNTYTWLASSIAFNEGGFKFRTNDLWDENIGWGQVEISGDIDDFSDNGGNIQVSAAGVGDYKITLTTSDDGVAYQAAFEKL